MAMMLYRARETDTIDYGMRAPGSLRPEDYPLTRDGAASDILPLPRIDDRNLQGPGTIAVPGVVAGMEEVAATPNCLGGNCWARASISPARASWWTGGPR
jgi:gamma-glutamyltranspeptidase / glutathione hydrolase